MNLHFIFFLLDVLVWLSIAFLFCSQIYVEKSKRVKLSKTTILGVFTLSLLSGLFSVLVYGIPDIGLSINSIIYASIAPFGLFIYTQKRLRKLILKYNKQEMR